MHRYFNRTAALALFLTSAALGLLTPTFARATLYQPGETINPDCAPGSSSCGVMNTALTQGGNSFGAAASLGTNDNYPLYFRANSSTAMTILANGNVGIGTTAPNASLALQGAAGVNPFTIVSSTGGTLLMLTSTGNLGIGTTSPTFQLTTYSNSTNAVLGAETGAGGSFPLVALKDGRASGVQWNIENGREAAGMLGFYYGGTRMVINNLGNVGIGTSTPQSTLAIQGSGSVNPFAIFSSTGATLLTVTPSGNVVMGTTVLPGSLPVSPLAYGAVADAKTVSDASITTNTPTLTSATAAFTSADVGKVVSIQGAAASGLRLISTISAYVNATTVTLAGNAGTTVSGAHLIWGTDNRAAFVSALAAAAGKTLVIPDGNWLVRTTTVAHLEPASGTTITGRGVVYWVGVSGAASGGDADVQLFTVADGNRDIMFDGLRVRGENSPFSAVFGNYSVAINVAGTTATNVSVKGAVLEDLFGAPFVSFTSPGNTNINLLHSTLRNVAGQTNLNSDYSAIEGNVFENAAGIEGSGAYSRVTDNILKAPFGQYAIAVGGRTAGSPYLGSSVSGNIIQGPTGSCISIGDAFSSGVVENNQCIGVPGTAMGIVNVNSGYVANNNNSFLGNTVTGSGACTAFYLVSVSGVRLRGNRASGCAFGLAGSAATGIESIGNSWAGSTKDISLGSNSTISTFDNLIGSGLIELATGSTYLTTTLKANGTAGIPVMGGDAVRFYIASNVLQFSTPAADPILYSPKGIAVGNNGRFGNYSGGGSISMNSDSSISLRRGNDTVYLNFVGDLPTYADNAAAVAGGLVAPAVYRTATGQLMVVY